MGESVSRGSGAPGGAGLVSPRITGPTVLLRFPPGNQKVTRSVRFNDARGGVSQKLPSPLMSDTDAYSGSEI